MRSAIEWMREAIGEHLAADADARLAQATARHEQEAAQRAARARARLGTGEAREILGEAISHGAVDAAAHGALLAHVAAVAEAEVVARAGLTMALRAESTVLVEGVQRGLSELTADVRTAPAEPMRRALDGWVRAAGQDRAARLEAWADATERRAKIRARGPACPDDPPDDLTQRCAAFLDATHDAAEALVARAHHGAAAVQGLAAHARAAAPLVVDAIASPRGRARRVGRVFDALDLGRELAQRVETLEGRLVTARPRVVLGDARAKVVASALELGLPSERASLAGAVEGLVRMLVSRTLPLEHRRAPIGSAALAVANLFDGFFADRDFVARHFEVGERESHAMRLAGTLGSVLAARHACAVLLAPAHDEGAREIVARALVLDPSEIPVELARPSRTSPLEQVTEARTALAALAWAPALRDRYDEDFHRNPRLADFVRGAAARGGTVSAEALTEELGSSHALAAARVVELAQRAGG